MGICDTHDVAVACHIDTSAYFGGTWRIELLGVVFNDTGSPSPFRDDFAVQRPHHQLTGIVGRYRPDDVVSVGQLMVGELSVEETIDTLVGCHP